MWSALQHLAFRWLFASSLASLAGSKIHRIALLFVAYQETQNAVWVSLILGAQFLASAVLGPLLGPLSDRYDRRALMIVSNLARAALVACIPLFAIGSMPLLMGISFLMAVFESVHYASSNSAIPDMVPESALDSANGLMMFVQRFSEIAFVALAGTLVAAVGPVPAFWINALSYLVAAGLLIFLPMLSGKAGRGNYFQAVAEGIRPLWQNPVLSRTIGTLALAAAFGSVEGALGIVYALGALKSACRVSVCSRPLWLPVPYWGCGSPCHSSSAGRGKWCLYAAWPCGDWCLRLWGCFPILFGLEWPCC